MAGSVRTQHVCPCVIIPKSCVLVLVWSEIFAECHWKCCSWFEYALSHIMARSPAVSVMTASWMYHAAKSILLEVSVIRFGILWQECIYLDSHMRCRMRFSLSRTVMMQVKGRGEMKKRHMIASIWHRMLTAMMTIMEKKPVYLLPAWCK